RRQALNCYRANPMRPPLSRPSTTRFRDGSTRTTRSSISMTSRCRGNACSSIATPICAGLSSSDTLGHTFQNYQAQIRLGVKIKVLAGVARRLAETIGIAAIIDRSHRSPVATSHDRVRFLKLAWDAIGSEFGSRHTQYEMFYAGARYVSCGHSYRTYDGASASA